MTKHLAGLIKFPCRVVPIVDADVVTPVVYCDIVDDRGLRIATALSKLLADAIVDAMNRGGKGDYDV